MKGLVTALSFVCVVLIAAPAGSESHAWKIEDAPKEWAGAIARADAGIEALKKGLMGKLKNQIAEGGPVSAIHLCHDEAQAITARMAGEQGITMGRTSHKLRNPANAPRDWVAAYVEASAGKKADAVDSMAVDLGDRVGIIRPIGTMGLCLNCHGAREMLSPQVKAALAEKYPEDQATGFAVGDVRGLFWVEVPK